MGSVTVLKIKPADWPAMARPLRIEFPHVLDHVTCHGHVRQRIIKTDADRQAWLAVLGQVIGRFGWLCHAYYPMDNHYHLLIETPQADRSRIGRRLGLTGVTCPITLPA